MSFGDDVAVRTIWAEARGEPREGQAAVAHVIRNRIARGAWGPNAATVCMWPSQFSCWHPSDVNFLKLLQLDERQPPLPDLYAIWDVAGREPDPVQGACFYFTDSIPMPGWANGMTEIAHIGHHRFFKDK